MRLLSRFSSPYFREGFAVLLFLLTVVVIFGSYRRVCRFKSEVISITVEADRLMMDGLYRYENNLPFPVPQGLSCPFPSGLGLGEIEQFSAELIGADSESVLPVQWIGGVPYFQVSVAANSVAEVRVRYIQRIADRGKYILTTTQPWQQPLEHGLYILTLRDRTLRSCNYVCDRVGPESYQFERTEFMPDRDWEFELSHGGKLE